jgi:recombination protein RecA
MDNKILKETLKSIQQKYGKDSISLFDESKNILANGYISTGSLGLNNAIGADGYPRGKITEIYGPESSGKTTLALHAIAECQKNQGIVAFIDAEHAFDVKYAESIGVKTSDLMICQPDSGEQALDIIETLAKTGNVDLIVVDSVAALVPEIEVNGDMGDQTIGAHARLMSKALRILNGIVSKSNTCLIFINQLREKVGIIFGNPEVTTGGRALKFYSSLRLEVRKDSLIKDGSDNIGLRTKVNVVKNKIASPFGCAFIDIYFGKGFDYASEIIDFAVTYGIIDKSGSWYSYKEQRIGQGKQQLLKFFAEDKLFKELKAKVIENINKVDSLKKETIEEILN